MSISSLKKIKKKLKILISNEINNLLKIQNNMINKKFIIECLKEMFYKKLYELYITHFFKFQASAVKVLIDLKTNNKNF